MRTNAHHGWKDKEILTPIETRCPHKQTHTYIRYIRMGLLLARNKTSICENTCVRPWLHALLQTQVGVSALKTETVLDGMTERWDMETPLLEFLSASNSLLGLFFSLLFLVALQGLVAGIWGTLESRIPKVLKLYPTKSGWSGSKYWTQALGRG